MIRSLIVASALLASSCVTLQATVAEPERMERGASRKDLGAALVFDPSDAAALNALAAAHSLDVATRAFREHVAGDPLNRRFRSLVDALAAASDRDARLARMHCEYRLALVPGWRYRSRPDNGSDLGRLQALAARYGIAYEVIATDEEGTIEDNAVIVAAHLRERADPRRAWIIASASKGGPEVAEAIATLAARGQHAGIAAWINVSGLIGGSPIADRSLAWPDRWVIGPMLAVQGSTMRPVASMSTRVRRERRDALALPAEIVVVSYFAAPLAREISARAAFGYELLRAHGPNDGVMLLADALLPGAITLLEHGTDHFLSAPALEPRFEALLAATMLIARGERPTSCAGT